MAGTTCRPNAGWRSDTTSPPSRGLVRSSARTLAAQFGYLPGTLWIIIGSVLGGCVQDMTILMLSMRRDGRSLGQMARDELGPVGGFAALIGTLMIMIILIAVLGLVVVNAMKHSPWATSTVFATIPVAILVGFYMRSWRPGRVLEASAIGVALIALSVFGGGWIDQQPTLRAIFDYPGASLAGFVIVYGWLAAILPVWLLLAPRDYLSTFLKLGTVFLLAIAILLMHPQIKMPAMTQSSTAPDRCLQVRYFRSSSSLLLVAPCRGSMRWFPAARRRSSSRTSVTCV